MHAAANGGAERVVAHLITCRADIESRCRAGRTPLAEAARSGHLPVVMRLVRAGAPADEDAVACAKGSACRSWLASRRSGRHISEEPQRGARHGRERRSEHQPVGKGGKAGGSGSSRRHQEQRLHTLRTCPQAKAKQLKEQRAKARAAAAATAAAASADAADESDGGGETVAVPDVLLTAAREPLRSPASLFCAPPLCLRASAPLARCAEALSAAVSLPDGEGHDGGDGGDGGGKGCCVTATHPGPV